MNFNPGYSKNSHSLAVRFAVLVLAVLAGCITVGSNTVEQICPELSGSEHGGRISVFLHAAYPGVVRKDLEFNAVEVLSGAEWIPIMPEPRRINSGRFDRGQSLLGSRIIPAGEYRLFRVAIASGAADYFTEIALTRPIVITSGSSNALFLKWDPKDHQVPFKLDGTSQTEHVASKIVVISCPEIDTLYFVRTDKNRIYGTLAVAGISHVVVDDLNKRLFVLVPQEAKIKVVDLLNRTIVDEIDIPATLEPNYMFMDPEKKNAFILDERGNMTRIDVQTGNMMARNRIGNQLANAIYMDDKGTLAVSAVVDRKVYFVDPVDLRVLEAISTEGEPHGLLELNGRLYITEPDLDNVIIYDLDERRVLKVVPVAAGPWDLANYEDSVYVSNRLDASIFLIKDGFSHVVKEIAVGAFPNAMSIDERRRFLYVGSGDCQGTISVVDITSNRLSGTIELGARPLDVEVVN